MFGLVCARVMVLVVSVVAAVGVFGCGGSSGNRSGAVSGGGSAAGSGAGSGGPDRTAAGNGGVAIRVGGQVVSAAAVRHWVPIEAILSTEGVPKGPVPPGVVPDPPAYTACIGHLEVLAAAKPGTPKQGRDALKKECEKNDASVREHILKILINDLWVRGEAAARHITVSDDEVRQRIRANLSAQFGNEAGFRKYLVYTGLTMGDELELYRKNLLSTKLLEKVLQRPGMTSQQRARAFAEFVTRWVAKTSCEPQYIVPDCKEYKGPIAPGS